MSKEKTLKTEKPSRKVGGGGKQQQSVAQNAGKKSEKTFPKRIKRYDLVVKKEKQKAMHKYKKMIRKEGGGGKTQPGFSSAHRRSDKTTSTDNPKYLTANKKAQLEYEAKKKETEQRLEEKKRREEEKQSALKQYKVNKKKKFKDLCKKNKNGQILMGRQIDSLLEKIEKNNKTN